MHRAGFVGCKVYICLLTSAAVGECFFFTKCVTEILQNSGNTCLPPPTVEAKSKRDPNQRRHIVLKERPLRLFVMFMKDAPAPCVTTVGVPRAGSEVRSE